MKRLISLCTFLIVLLLLTQTANGQSNYYFKQISVQDGLSQSTVRCTYYDSRGFLWIGTKNGLNRYEPFNLQVYQNSLHTPNLLPSNTINFICEDKTNRLWVGTEAGLVYYDYLEDCFNEVKLTNGTSPWLRTAYSLDSGILFGGSGGLFYFDYSTKELLSFPINYADFDTIQDAIIFLSPWKDSLLLIGTRRDGLWIYDRNTSVAERASFCEYKNIMGYHLDENKNLWLSPYNKGVVQYDNFGKRLQHFTSTNSRLSDNVVLDIKTRNEEVWFATDGSGISVWNSISNNFTSLNHDPGDVNSFPVNSVLSLYVDKADNMWAGSIRGGLVGIRKVYMKSYRDVVPNNNWGLSEKTILSLYEDSSGLMWIGTDGGGVNSLNLETKHFTHFKETFTFKVASIAEYDSSHLLLSVFSRGFYLFHKQTGQVTAFNPFTEQEDKELFYSGNSVNISSYSPDSLLLFANKVYLYTISENRLTVLGKDFHQQQLQSFKHIRKNESSLYYFANATHIYALDVEQNSINIIYKASAEERIQTIEASGETIWIGTNRGLKTVRLDDLVSTSIESDLFDDVNALVLNPLSGLWIGAHGQLFNLNPRTNIISVFGESCGAVYNEYLAKPTWVSQSGQTLLGGVMGLLEIDSNIEWNGKRLPDLWLSGLKLNGVFHLDMVKEQRISIPWDYSSLELTVMPKDDDIFQDIAYRFQILGSDDEFVTGVKNTLSLYALPVGSYDVRVSYTSQNGVWSPYQTVLNVRVTPPWWSSWWGILVWIVIALGLFGTYHLYVTRKRKRDIELLKNDEIQKQNEERIRFLVNVSHELRTPLTLMYAPLKRLLNRMDATNIYYSELVSIYRKTKQMRNMVNMTLDIRELEKRKFDVSLTSVHLSTFISTVAEEFTPELSEKDIKLELVVDYDGYVQLDQTKCEVILSNFLMNAYKFSPNDSTITLSVYKKDMNIHFEVSDEGIGLSDEDLKSVFERFYQGSHTVKGSGIGLSYAKVLVNAQQGVIGAHNNKESGASFWFEIPLNGIEVKERLLTSMDEGVDKLSIHNYPINPVEINAKLYSLAIVEDDLELREFIATTFRAYFKEVFVCSNGEEGLKVIEDKQPDLVVSDVMMPRMDGFELCRAIKNTADISHIPVVLLTARVDEFSEKIGYKMGADAYIAKPFDIDDLVSLVKNLLYTRNKIKMKVLGAENILDSVNNTFSPNDELFTEKLNSIITDHIADPELDVQFIANEIGMSRASLYNKLKAIGGVGVNDYIISCRINNACVLLLETDQNIGEISDAVGFNNQRYFSTVFKQVKGVSPSAYRKQ